VRQRFAAIRSTRRPILLAEGDAGEIEDERGLGAAERGIDPA
jgi:hypothetical protein